MAVLSNPILGGNGRTWFQVSGPSSAFLYGGCYGMGDVAIPEGDRTQIFCPSSTRPNEWDVVGTIRGLPGNPTVSLEAPMELTNYLLTLRCPFTIQQRFQECSTPEDPDSWESMLHFKQAEITQRGVTGLNARQPGDNAMVNVTANLTFQKMTHVKRMEFVNVQAFSGADDIAAISFCDEPSCPGNCGIGSIGCQIGFAVTQNGIYKTEDGGSTWAEITSPFTGIYDNVVDVACKGDIVIIVNGTTAGQVARSQDGGTTWTLVTLPNAIVASSVFMVDSSRVYVVGADGYVWYSTDGGRTFTAQSTGGATTEDLTDVFFFDATHGWAVGANGAIIRTVDGLSWAAVTSGVATQLNTVHFITQQVGFAAGASGALRKSVDGGASWAAATWFGAGSDVINEITSCEESFVFFGASGGGAAKVYQSVDGGASADLLDIETTAANALYCCAPDKLYVGGDNGIVVTGS